MRTGLVADVRYLDHDPGAGHVESTERLRVLLDLVDGPLGEGLLRLEPREATDEEVALVHTPEHLARVAASEGRAHVSFDPDTSSCAGTHRAARLAAGGFLALLDAVVAGEARNGIALVRPPGHHAEASHAMGFCFFNNVAIGARHLRERHGVERVMILDWDVHHGNGTQHTFEADPDVLFVSLHQYPFYPGTGSAQETGRGAGAGRTVNVPMSAGAGDAEYAAAFRDVVDPVAREFDPHFVLISAGFDADIRDPLAQIRLTTEAYRKMTRHALSIARDHAEGRLAAVLEGGYDLSALREDVAATIEELRE